MSCFNLYSKESTPLVKQQNPSLRGKEIVELIIGNWNKLDEASKRRYEAKLIVQEHYKQNKNEAGDLYKHKKLKKKQFARTGWNAFEAHRRSLSSAEKNKKKTVGEISDEWKNLPPLEKKKMEILSKELDSEDEEKRLLLLEAVDQQQKIYLEQEQQQDDDAKEEKKTQKKKNRQKINLRNPTDLVYFEKVLDLEIENPTEVNEIYLPSKVILHKASRIEKRVERAIDWRLLAWKAMPSFNQVDKKPYCSFNVVFENEASKLDFCKKFKRKPTLVSTLWITEGGCDSSISSGSSGSSSNSSGSLLFISADKNDEKNRPQYPIYIISKGRSTQRLTANALDKMQINFYMVVEQQELSLYEKKVHQYCTLLVLPETYSDSYDTCDDLGNTKSKGPGPARNYCWDHSIQLGYEKHWVIDDNCRSFQRLYDNLKIRVQTATIFRCAEDFVARYENVPLAGFNYSSFCVATSAIPPFVENTRIYSCLLIQNKLNLRWRGRYNEDTDLSLRILKTGQCTLQFNAFLIEKVRTQVIRGGNTTEFYEQEGTKPKSEMLVKLHGDVTKITNRFSRYHHLVDYRQFKKNKLILKSKLNLNLEEVNEYDFKLINDTAEKENEDRPVEQESGNNKKKRNLDSSLSPLSKKIRKITQDENENDDNDDECGPADDSGQDENYVVDDLGLLRSCLADDQIAEN